MILRVFVRAPLRTGVGFWMEIITGVERRRRWRLEEKLRIVAEVEQAGASFAEIARRHEVSLGCCGTGAARSGVASWRPEPMPTFLPMRITMDSPVRCRRPYR